MGDCLDTIEAAYRLDLDEHEWLQRIADTSEDWIDAEGIGAWTHEVSGTDELRIEEAVMSTGSPGHLLQAPVRGARAHPQFTAAMALQVGPCGTVSEAFGGAVPEEVREHNPPGIEDGIGIIGQSPEGNGVHLTAALSQVRRLDRRERARGSRVAAHLGTAYRLRIALGNRAAELPDRRQAEAVLAPDGACVHAEGTAKTPSARDRLRTMTRDVDRARTRTRRRDPDEALELWRGLVSGRWSLVDHFDSDGRRYVVAMRNPPAGRPVRALSEREAQVAAVAALGYSNKLVAYALGLAPSTVAAHLRSAIRKLGLRDRTQLVARLAPFAGLEAGV